LLQVLLFQLNWKINLNQKLPKAAQQLRAAEVKVFWFQRQNAQLLVLAINQALASESFVNAGLRQIRKGSASNVSQLVADIRESSYSYHEWCESCIYFSNSVSFQEGLRKLKHLLHSL
jgi:molybdopterin-containing oxidoreductase family iron-sulfur binding subunit